MLLEAAASRPQPSLRLATVLLCHNYYQEPGGEDQVFADEAALLAAHGHEVLRYTRHNDSIRHGGRLAAARASIWNREVYHELRALLRRTRPSVMHCTNTFPLISPAAYYAARAEGVPVVQSLHNFRLLCPAAALHREGAACEECLGRFPWPGIVHGCYRRSRLGTAAVAAMLGLHRMLGTWTRTVDRYIALTRFSRDKFVAGGLPEQRIAVKPNCLVADPGQGPGDGGYAVFVGRLSTEKGLDVLLAAWRSLSGRIPLVIVGDGPLADQVRQAAAVEPGIRWLGRQTPAETLRLIGDAALLVLPSSCYENCPKTILEAYAKGTPVVASRLGAMAELVDDERTGLLFEPGNAADLAQKVGRLAGSAELRTCMARAARGEFQANYTAESNYAKLMEIYGQACGNSSIDARQPSAAGREPS